MSDKNTDPKPSFLDMSKAQKSKALNEEENQVNRDNDQNNAGKTGGTGGAGGTGGPGQEDTTIDAATMILGDKDGGAVALQPEYFAQDELGDDPMRYQYKHIVGSTGAMGGKGDTPKFSNPLAQQTISPEDMEKALADWGYQMKMLNEEQTRQQLHRQNVIGKGVISTALSKMLGIAWVYGGLFRHMKHLVLTREGNWGEEIEIFLKELEMSRRTMDKYVNINATPGILKHPYLGIDAAENVIQAMAPIRHTLDKKDPISDFFKNNGAQLDYTQANKQELNELAKAVIVHEKLRNADIEGDYKVIGDFLRLAKTFTAVDLAVMKDRKDRGLDPIEYMSEVIAAWIGIGFSWTPT